MFKHLIIIPIFELSQTNELNQLKVDKCHV